MKNNQTNNKPVTGNTLDYYNDDMSRKAVGKLFDNLDDLTDQPTVGQDTSSIVVGYDDPQDDFRPEPPEPDRPEPVYEPVDPAMERAIERAAELATGHAPEYSEPDDIRTPERARSRVFNEEYDMSLYRRNKNILDEEEYEEILRPRKRSRNPEPAVIRRSDPPKDEPPMPPRRKPAEGLHSTDGLRSADGSRPADRIRSADGLRSADRIRSADRVRPEPDDYIEKVQVQRERDEILRAANAHRRLKMLQPYIAGIFVVLMIAMALLLFRNNSLSKRLDEAEAEQDKLNTSLEHYSEVLLANEALEKEIAELRAELESSPSPQSPTESGDPEAPTGTAQQAPAESETTLPAKYVVRDGDNLSKISNKFYGTPNQYEKIKDANGLTSDTVIVGQTLTIPE